MRTIDSVLAEGGLPIIAILRGVSVDEVLPVAKVLIAARIRMIEVPLNSPNPFTSIARLQSTYGELALIGAGTVLDCASVEAVSATGARLMVTPNVNPDVIARGLALGLEVMPGCLTPTEAFAAVDAGARRLKLFPASAVTPNYLKSVQDVLPKQIGVWAVGGVDAENANQWLAAGAEGVGIGGSLYRPGDNPDDVGCKAAQLMKNHFVDV